MLVIQSHVPHHFVGHMQVMECCEGGELFDRIAEKGHLTEKAAAELMRTIVSVVHHW